MMTTFNFLVRPGRFTLDLPSGLDPVPTATGMIEHKGARSIGYTPTGRFSPDDVRHGYAHAFDTVSDGRRVSVYERQGSPETTVGIWHLPDGYLVTCMDDVRRPTQELETVIDHLAVREAPGEVPRLELDAPVRAYADEGDLLSWEYVQFLPRDRSHDAWPLIAIRARPDARRSSRSGVRDEGPWVEAWEDTDLGLRVAAYGKASGRNALRGRAREVASSIRRVD